MKQMKLVVLSLLLALVAACANQPQKNEMLSQAREAVQQAEDSPAVARYAPVALREARESLRAAEQAFRQGANEGTVNHLAYLATKRAAIAQAVAKREVIVASAEKAGEQRQQILMQSREQAAERARQQALEAQRQAEQARREAELAREQARMQAEEANKARQALQEAQQKLADLEPKQTERGLVLTLDEVLFPFNSAELQAGNVRALDRLADYLRNHPNYSILIEGHTDSVGDAAYNQRLSERRAESVREAMVQRGIDPNRIRSAGLGENFPVASNANPAGRSENRRVEVVIAEGQMPPTLAEQRGSGVARGQGEPIGRPRG